LTCKPGYIYWAEDNTCYQEINWAFPFLILAALSFLTVLITDCIKKQTDFLHSTLFFLSFCEVGTWIALILLYVAREVKGDRSKSLVAFMFQLILNLVFMPVHCRLMWSKASDEYK